MAESSLGSSPRTPAEESSISIPSRPSSRSSKTSSKGASGSPVTTHPPSSSSGVLANHWTTQKDFLLLRCIIGCDALQPAADTRWGALIPGWWSRVGVKLQAFNHGSFDEKQCSRRWKFLQGILDMYADLNWYQLDGKSPIVDLAALAYAMYYPGEEKDDEHDRQKPTIIVSDTTYNLGLRRH